MQKTNPGKPLVWVDIGGGTGESQSLRERIVDLTLALHRLEHRADGRVLSLRSALSNLPHRSL
jgi:hypothetical protein